MRVDSTTSRALVVGWGSGLCANSYRVFVVEVDERGGDKRKGQARENAEAVAGDFGQRRRAAEEGGLAAQKKGRVIGTTLRNGKGSLANFVVLN